MLLNEFFGKAINPIKDLQKGRDDKNIGDDLFWYIVDHDKLHKDFFHPIAVKMKKSDFNKEKCVSEFLPMVNKGCKEYYTHNKMQGKLGKVFSEELRKDMCERLYDHYKEDIVKDKYKLGF
jgi:hypothetical protein